MIATGVVRQKIDAEPASAPVRLVIVDDDPIVADFMETSLAQSSLRIFRATTGTAGWELIRRVHPEIVLLDQVIPDLPGMELLERIIEWDSTIQVVLVSGDHSTSRAVEAMRKGACDYLTKPITSSLLRERVADLIDSLQARTESIRRAEESDESCRFGEMVGSSQAMRDVYNRIRRIGANFRIALVTGPTGTGKELVARALHRHSPSANRPFVVCNCAAIVETLFESELFGHARGAFTGAIQDRPGLFEAADGGTLFLDEIGEIPLHLQSKLLRVLQNSELQRVGSHALRRIDVRVVAATNRDLREMARKNQFREDLFYRLSMLEVKLPPLCERRGDIPLLQRHFLDYYSEQYGKRVKGLTRRTQALLSRYLWPGNVRELQNVMGHACMMTDSDMIDIPDLPEYLHSREASRDHGLTLEEVEKRHVHQVLAQVDGNKLEAAEILGISRATIYRILAEKEA